MFTPAISSSTVTSLFEFRSNEEFLKRFRREARLAGSISHPNLVQVFDFIDSPEMLGYVMEYVEGRDLKDVVVAEGPLEVDRALDIFHRVCSGLAALHKIGIVHRDIKPQNIMLLEGDMPKITDFGLAKNTTESEQSIVTGEGRSMGTPAFMSPEQAEDAANASHLSDIYSLGASIYYCLAGRPPFSGKVYDVIKMVCTQPPPPLSAVRAGIDPALVKGVDRMMAKNPSERFSSPEEIQAFLETLG